jgi:hypothetical protein
VKNAITIFLDTSALKHSADRLIRGRVHQVTRRSGAFSVTTGVTQFVEVYPNAKLPKQMATEVLLYPFFAYLAKRQQVKLITHHEVLAEFWGLPKTDDPRGRFYGAPIGMAPTPVPYSRVVFGLGLRGEKRDWQFEFVRNLQHPRFLELRSAVGAQEVSRSFKNQLLDAFHIFCAENAQADYFLTTDMNLVSHVENHKRYPPLCKVVSPKGLLIQLATERKVRLRHVAGYAIDAFRSRNKPKSLSPLEDLVTFGRHLEKEGQYQSDPPKANGEVHVGR